MTADRLSAGNFAARVALFYGALFVIYGMHVPFTPLWLAWRGLSPGEISAAMAVPFFLRVFITPAVALAADRHNTHRGVMIVLAWLSLAVVLALSQASTFWPILFLIAPLVICNSSVMPLAETVAVRGVREAGLDYGRMRLWGSLTFIAASFGGGMVIDRHGAGAGIWLVAFGCVLTVIAAHLLPRLARPEGDVPASAKKPLWHAQEPRALLAQPAFRSFLVAAGGAQAAHAALLTYATLIWQSQGMSAGTCGMLWAVAVIAEVGLFAWSGPLLARFGSANILIAGAAFSIVRWAAMAFDPPLALLVPLQMLHAVTYGGSHIGAIYFIAGAVPPAMQGSAQALYATIASGVAMGTATLVAGWLYAGAGSGMAYAAMAVLSLISLAAAWHLKGIWDGGVLTAAASGPESAAPRRGTA